jgi:hypothetical protein
MRDMLHSFNDFMFGIHGIHTEFFKKFIEIFRVNYMDLMDTPEVYFFSSLVSFEFE